MAKKKRKPDPPVDTELPITPMLDMTFQLMAFFIMTFNPTPSEGQLNILLPKDDPSKNAVPDVSIPDDVVLEYKLQVYTDHGEIAGLSLKADSGTESIDGTDKKNALFVKLSAIAASGTPKKIVIESAPDLKYARLIELMDICKKAGFDSIGIGQLNKKTAEAPAANPMPKQ